MARYDFIEEVNKNIDIIEHVEKFNPYHDARGRFTSGGTGAVSFSGTAGQMRNYGQKKQEFDAMMAGKDTASAEIAKNMVAAAAKREPEITKTIQDSIADVPGATMVGLDYKLKGEGSLHRKIRDESIEKGITPEEAAKKMYDVNRYTVQNDEKNLTATIKNTLSTMEKQGYEVMRVKNTLAKEDAEYRGINMVVKAKDGGMFELQFHTQKSLEIKEVNHKLYEKQRESTTSRAEKIRLGEEMRANAKSIPTPDDIGTIETFNNLPK